MHKNLKIMLLILFVPGFAFAQSTTIFNDYDPDDDSAPAPSNNVLGNFFGNQAALRQPRWEKFHSLEEYGHSPISAPEAALPDPQEEEAKRAYLKSKDPFANDRLDELNQILAK